MSLNFILCFREELMCSLMALTCFTATISLAGTRTSSRQCLMAVKMTLRPPTQLPSAAPGWPTGGCHPVIHRVLDILILSFTVSLMSWSCCSHCPWCEDILSFTLSLMWRHPVIHSVPDILVQSFTVSLMSWSSHSKCPWCQNILSLTLSLMSRHNVIHIFLDVKTSCHSHCTWCQDILSFT